jgi:hypothetical protein
VAHLILSIYAGAALGGERAREWWGAFAVLCSRVQFRLGDPDPDGFTETGETNAGDRVLFLLTALWAGHATFPLCWHAPTRAAHRLDRTVILGGLAHILLNRKLPHAPASLVARSAIPRCCGPSCFGYFAFR